MNRVTQNHVPALKESEWRFNYRHDSIYRLLLSELTQDFAKTLGIRTLYVNAAPEAADYYKAIGWELFSWNPAELTSLAKDCIQMRWELS